MLKRFPHYLQLDAKDCGPTCLRMVAKYYGRDYSLQTLRERSYITRSGVTMLGISDAAEAIGFRTTGVRLTFDRLVDTPPVPCILHWNQHHFVVCYAIKKSRKGVRIYISDPASERLVYTEKEFNHCWLGEGAGEHEKVMPCCSNPVRLSMTTRNMPRPVGTGANGSRWLSLPATCAPTGSRSASCCSAW